MKIGIFCTNNYPYPLPKNVIYASIPIAAQLAEGLSKKGLDVTYFGPEGTKVDCKLETFHLPSFDTVYHTYGSQASFDYENVMFSKILEIADSFDILHSHIRPLSILPWFEVLNHKGFVQTVHDPLSYPTYNVLQYYDTNKVKFISITNAQQKTNKYVDWFATVYNGIDPSLWTFQATPQDYYVWVGRIIPEKGLHNAIHIAKNLGIRLKIAGQINELDPVSKEYFEKTIKPQFSSQIEYVGQLSQQDLAKFYGNAKGFIYPFEWMEPFGLTMVEAMLCGTPVFSLHNGSAPELIKNGVSGYYEDTLETLEQRIMSGEAIDRKHCHDYAVEHFSIHKMIEGYHDVYTKILQ